MLERLGVEPGESLYVGDSPSDVDASREAGVAVAAAAWANTADPELLQARRPDLLFTTVGDFGEYIGQNFSFEHK
ncbi:Pyrophosphatase PpaX [compost metagenome]